MRFPRRHEDHDTPFAAAVTIRRLDGSEADLRALRALAERDSRSPLDGQVLVAEVEGRALAAISLATGDLLADPFSRTDELRSLLELRAAQLRRRERRAGGRSERVHRARAHAALAGSPPGAGGRLLEL
jgi:hypothetical protein